MDQAQRALQKAFPSEKQQRVLSTGGIVFWVVAAAAPMAAMVGNLPIAFARGNGAGVPGAILVAALTLLCFSVGYAAMSRRLVSTGGFYTYITYGLGKLTGVASAWVAVVAYGAMTVGLAISFGYFSTLVLAALGIAVPWWQVAAVGIAITAVLGYRSVDLSSKIVGTLMVAEIGILAIFDLMVVTRQGLSALPLSSFAPGTVFGPGFSIGLMMAYTCFIGFESAALYGEEARAPARSIPKATYIAVALIGGFYLLTAWATVGAAGAGSIKGLSAKELGETLFVLIKRYCGESLADAAGVLLCTSLLASYLAMHNACTRYVFALGREGVLPKALGRFHPTRYAPSNASAMVSGLTLLLAALFALDGHEPYLVALPSMIGLSTLGVILLQALACVAMVAYLRRQPGMDFWKTLALPGLGAMGLTIAVALVSWNFPLVTGVSNSPINALPWLYPPLLALGLLYALWLKRARPALYKNLGMVELRYDANSSTARLAPPPAKSEDRYCIVGAGPCGLLAARALKLEGIAYDQFERHSGVGGIWDINNPGTPMYESAHFISSKFSSGFFGHPMPEHYPDYPSHQQLLVYVNSFAREFGLLDRVQFNTGVQSAVPLGEGARDGWRVTLNDGSTRHYQGLICANGVTWHPSLPSYPGMADFEGEMRHTLTHRDAAELKGRRVLIVGCGNSGADIACDAARNADTTFISVRRGYRFVPKHLFGVPTDVFLQGLVPPPKGVIVPDDPNALLDAVVGDLTRFGLPKPDHQVLESHPIMNTQILHHLAHGDLRVKGDVKRFTSSGAEFLDGSHESFDLVLFATGYDYKIPYLDPSLFNWRHGRPELYLNIFHRQLQGLAVMGFAEFADAGFKRFDEMAQMVAMDASLRASGHRLGEWLGTKAEHQPDLRGAKHYIDSPRHAAYVDAATYRRELAEIRARFGWFDPTDLSYEVLRKSPVPAA